MKLNKWKPDLEVGDRVRIKDTLMYQSDIKGKVGTITKMYVMICDVKLDNSFRNSITILKDNLELVR